MHTVSIVLGTAREGRQSEKVARLLYNELLKREIFHVVYVDVRDCVSTASTVRYDEKSGSDNFWYNTAMQSDAFIFVLPEYNHGYPGEWKLLMDSLYKKAYMGKRAGLVGVSNGQFGGVRALESATLSLSTRGMYVMKDALHFPFVETHFDTTGELVYDEQRVRVEKFFETFKMSLDAHVQS